MTSHIVCTTGSRLAALLSCAALLGACGGGSDTPAPAPTPAPTPPPLVALLITAANQDAVARASANVVVSAAATGAVAPLSADGRVAASGAKRSAGALPSFAGVTSVAGVLQRFAQFAVHAPAARAMTPATGQVRTLAVIRVTEPCGASGNVTIELNDADNSGALSAGDSASFSFNACSSGQGESIDGGLALRVASVSGPNISGTLTYNQLRLSTLDASFAINGSVNLVYTEAGTLATYRSVVGAGGLSTLVTAQMFSDELTLRAGFEQLITSDTAAVAPGTSIPGLNTASVNGELTANSLGGIINVVTVAPFQRYAVDPYPRAGQLTVAGAGGSRLRVTALSATTVRIELDADGNGSYEQSRDVAWSALL